MNVRGRRRVGNHGDGEKDRRGDDNDDDADDGGREHPNDGEEHRAILTQGRGTVIRLILLVFALVCFILAALPMTQPYHPRLLAAGLAFLTASMIPWPVT